MNKIIEKIKEELERRYQESDDAFAEQYYLSIIHILKNKNIIIDEETENLILDKILEFHKETYINSALKNVVSILL